MLEENTFTNGGVFLGVTGDQGHTTFRNNNFTFDVSENPQSAVIRNSLFVGVSRNINFFNNNVTLNFANSAGNSTRQKFMEVDGDFDLGNTVQKT